ncbi:MAG TPA: PadR family transcriptional regulator [Bryobacteraceae bacterium]
MVEYLLVNHIDLLHGTLDLMILQTLKWGPQHGHGIGQAIRASSRDALQVEHGSLYPALHRLERRGWLAAEWKMSEANRRARYYRLTPKGKKQLLKEQSRWKALVRAVAQTMRPARG